MKTQSEHLIWETVDRVQTALDRNKPKKFRREMANALAVVLELLNKGQYTKGEQILNQVLCLLDEKDAGDTDVY